MQFITTLPPAITKVIAYSDSCGGQNKNKNIGKLFMYVVHSTNIQQIDHKFFVPGHSYMECDRDFALIEKQKKNNPLVFVPSHWTEIIKKASKNFVVHDMKEADFISFNGFDEVIKDPKKDSENRPLRWRDIQWFSFNKDNTYSFKFKDTLSMDFPFLQAEKCAKHKGRPSQNLTLSPLYTEPIKIRYEKWENLHQLLDYIPPIYHNFYNNLPHSEGPQKKTKGRPPKLAASEDHEEFPQEDETLLLESDYE